MADLDMSLEHRRELKLQATRSRTAIPAPEDAGHGVPPELLPVDPRLLRLEQKLDRVARQVSGLPTLESVRTMMIVLTAFAVGAGLVGGVLTHP